MIATGKVDQAGRLISADDRLLQLHASAGGSLGGPVVVPQIATLVRLARTLGILVSRPVIAAEGAVDLELLVRARPDGDMVHLSIGGWTEIAQIAPTPALEADRAHDFLRMEADAAWETDAELRIARLTSGLSGQLFSSPGSAIGQPLTAIFRLLPKIGGEMPLLAALANQRAFEGQLAEIMGRPAVTILMSGQPLYDPEGHFIGLRGSVARLDSGQDEERPDIGAVPTDDGFAQRLDTAIRKPLGQIIANADAIGTMSEGAIRGEYAAYARDVSAAGRHLLDLTDDVADLQAIERPDFAVDAEQIDLADIARRAAGLLSVRANDGIVKVDRPDEDEILMATGEYRRVLQIMVNLVGNAVRYSPPGGMVWIRTEVEGDLAAIIVADMGKGIAEEDQERIFEKFERVDTSEPGGSGLGLYIARKLARAMKGDISVDSSTGRGARFVLTLPRAE